MTTTFRKIVGNLYLYIFSTVGLVIFIVGGITLVNVVLKTYVFQLTHYQEWWNDTYGCQWKTNPDGTALSTEDMDACEVKQEEERAISDSDARKRDLANGVAEVVIGTPIWIYHWMVIRKKKDEEIA
ncbi:MAG: hypothetical protein ACD_51C00155G0008 [uncultured bacterium]|nr:MAG: hypothetical protein ACD_51C00155G0008 [uncultured bacterium]OGJ47637.1 MAG: hypothetical protein A2244_02770 [Candidatus Peregrinibacteria bacterium RIFOXYA2_FULL_41_18]OGJ48969.1 MAG: hypothetical protein A2344_00225 [Candidatus Peregrinibacteria bacterium RIFOXYB12_FULL_41_12]OGJ51507.1 MAG: hypothetical protein A2336_02325 [Candidatus Peregrinibacteria bacterium RIFOXYB2_FULL_41_88]OGJ52612.1 MAG: hypothetical protein A2448_02535 [Candidatus Peregrinibacteria bacterium RIFOXYC2_FULL